MNESSEQTPIPEDAELVRLVLAGRDEAYNELVRRHHARIYSLVYNMTGNKQDAEDVTQDVLLRAYKALPRFQGKAAFGSWLYRIAVNRTISFVKQRRNRFAVSLDDVDAGIERDPDFLEAAACLTPDSEAGLSEFQEKLNTALQKLSHPHRMVVVLHLVQGLPHEDIARLMKCSTGTVRSRLYYARRQLQAELSEFAP